MGIKGWFKVSVSLFQKAKASIPELTYLGINGSARQWRWRWSTLLNGGWWNPNLQCRPHMYLVYIPAYETALNAAEQIIYAPLGNTYVPQNWEHLDWACLSPPSPCGWLKTIIKMLQLKPHQVWVCIIMLVQRSRKPAIWWNAQSNAVASQLYDGKSQRLPT